MNNLTTTLITGFTATMAMLVSLWGFSRLKIADVDMVRATGSFFTKSLENALLPGFIILITGGFLFAFLYICLLSFLPDGSMIGYLALSTGMGIFHGIGISFTSIVYASHRHPVAKFREFGLVVAAGHVFGHVIFGITVGIMACAFSIRYAFVRELF